MAVLQPARPPTSGWHVLRTIPGTTLYAEGIERTPGMRLVGVFDCRVYDYLEAVDACVGLTLQVHLVPPDSRQTPVNKRVLGWTRNKMRKESCDRSSLAMGAALFVWCAW